MRVTSQSCSSHPHVLLAIKGQGYTNCKNGDKFCMHIPYVENLTVISHSTHFYTQTKKKNNFKQWLSEKDIVTSCFTCFAPIWPMAAAVPAYGHLPFSLSSDPTVSSQPEMTLAAITGDMQTILMKRQQKLIIATKTLSQQLQKQILNKRIIKHVLCVLLVDLAETNYSTRLAFSQN